MKMFRIIFAAFALATLVGSLTLMFGQSKGNGGRNASTEAGDRQAPDGRPMPPPHGGLDMHLLRELNLTSAQQEQFKALHEAARTASAQYFDQLKTIDDQLKAVTEAATFNEEQARKLLASKSQLMIELEVIHLRTDSAIYNALTAEQKAQLEQLKQQFRGFPRGGGDRPDGER